MGRKRRKSTTRKVIDTETDRISCLQGHVIDQILSCLPIREAVRTSVLSSQWRYKWYTLPNLVFDRRCVSTRGSQDPLDIENKLLKIVDHVLLLHSGPINKFEFSDSGHDFVEGIPGNEFDRWIVYLIGRSIKKLVLHVLAEDEIYKIPWCLFSCQSLQCLKLYCCWLKPPTTFEGFRNLKRLELYNISMANAAFEKMISGCPLLEYLSLIEPDGLTQVNIHAPNLKVFSLLGDFVDFSFYNSFQLTELSLLFDTQSNQSRLRGCSSNLLSYFAHLPHLRHLDISHHFLKYLAAGDVPVKLSTPFVNLSFLFICLRFNDMKEVLAALCLLRSSPNLQRLEIIADYKELDVLLTLGSYCWEDTFSGPAMPILRHVSIDGICGIRSELDFIKFILMYSPMLEKMIVKPGVYVRADFLTKLVWFRRASVQAEVIYRGKDSS